MNTCGYFLAHLSLVFDGGKRRVRRASKSEKEHGNIHNSGGEEDDEQDDDSDDDPSWGAVSLVPFLF